MSTSENTQPAQNNGLDAMRSPFPDAYIGKLPKGTKAQNECLPADKVNCKVCGGWHHPRIVHLDYVGHAAITGRLLDADPRWSWEPLAFTVDGLPRFDEAGGLWIKLTVAGMTRLGYGDAAGKHGPSAIKEAIGDALRNAAMRFGAALELWHKGNWEDDTFIPVKPEDPPERPALPPCQDAKIERWFTAVTEGKGRADELLSFARARHTLTDAQEGRILAFVANQAKPPIDANFVNEMESVERPADRTPGEDDA